MSFHHQSIESKLEMRQVQIIQANTMIIYAFVNILKNRFFMSTLFLLFNETFNSRSSRRNHSASSVNNDDEKNDDEEKKNENDDDDDDDDDDNDDKNLDAR